MSRVIIQEFTCKNPIEMIGMEAGVCYGADTSDPERNYKRGIDCLESGHGRAFEFPDVYMILDGYSARVIREWYTHIGCLPTRLQSSTRYIDYEHGFDYYIPDSVKKTTATLTVYKEMMDSIAKYLAWLVDLGVPKEDAANGLPLGMTTTIVDKRNLRNLIDMSHQRMCTRAYHEFRDLFHDVATALSEYSEQWAYIVDHYFEPKCEYLGYCNEKKSCGHKEKRESK